MLSQTFSKLRPRSRPRLKCVWCVSGWAYIHWHTMHIDNHMAPLQSIQWNNHLTTDVLTNRLLPGFMAINSEIMTDQTTEERQHWKGNTFSVTTQKRCFLFMSPLLCCSICHDFTYFTSMEQSSDHGCSWVKLGDAFAMMMLCDMSSKVCCKFQ